MKRELKITKKILKELTIQQLEELLTEIENAVLNDQYYDIDGAFATLCQHQADEFNTTKDDVAHLVESAVLFEFFSRVKNDKTNKI